MAKRNVAKGKTRHALRIPIRQVATVTKDVSGRIKSPHTAPRSPLLRSNSDSSNIRQMHSQPHLRFHSHFLFEPKRTLHRHIEGGFQINDPGEYNLETVNSYGNAARDHAFSVYGPFPLYLRSDVGIQLRCPRQIQGPGEPQDPRRRKNRRLPALRANARPTCHAVMKWTLEWLVARAVTGMPAERGALLYMQSRSRREARMR